MKRVLIYLIPVTMMLLASCANDDEANIYSQCWNKNEKPSVGLGLTRTQKKYATGPRSFEWRLLGEVSKNTDNVVLSPLGLEYILSIAANGADRETRNEIIRTLFSKDADIDEINGYYNKIANGLCTLDDKISMASHNSIWTCMEIPVNKKFISKVEDTFNAGFHSTTIDKMVNDVNEWCKVSTNGRISKILDDPCDFIILNASYFKGDWQIPFEKRSVKQSTFYGKTPVTADFMNNIEYMSFCSNDMYDIVGKKLGDGHFSFNLLLPKEGVSIAECIEKLESKGLDDKWSKGYVDLTMPKFSARCNTSLKDNLRILGINKAFDYLKAFSGISSAPLIINDVKQSNTIEINESGLDIASVSSAEFWMAAHDSFEISLTLCADRPFIYFITENSSDIMLYYGVITSLE